MRILRVFALNAVLLLSLLAGLAKIIQLPDERAFFDAVGLGSFIVPFGAVQFLAAVLLIFSRTHVAGAIIATIALFASAVMIFMAGNTLFGVVSLVPVMLGVFLVVDRLR